jgi:hypothetical protein
MMADHAIALAAKGICVFPCRARSKLPMTRHGCNDATTDVGVIRGWWSGWATANIAIATGSRSGLFVVDVDVKDGRNGEAQLRRLEEKHTPLPATVESVTGSGGRQLFFRIPDGLTIKNSVGKIACGLDVRGEGGYVIAPPSVHPCGRAYAWSVDSASQFADPPDWLIEEIERATGPARTSKREAISQLLINGVDDGLRNDSAARIAGALFRQGLNFTEVHGLLLAWNERCRPPTDEAEIESVVKSIGTRELSRRWKEKQ